MNTNTQIVSQLSTINVWNQHGQQLEQMYNRREDDKNILSCVHFARLFNVINKFSELNHTFVKEGINFPLS